MQGLHAAGERLQRYAEVAEVAEAAEVDAAALYAALLFLPRHPTDGRPGGSAASPQQG